ncbi:hypothetical protein KKF34_09005 [Myxococcota bacterium]|nr:hypothetical protein [Myxococcota bacterium]MBU1497000.1 hypothetical protein [Myxococcota bacterium]
MFKVIVLLSALCIWSCKEDPKKENCIVDDVVCKCGDGIVSNNGSCCNEECDRWNFNGLTCHDYGFDTGRLKCDSFCKIDSSQCTISDYCGDGQINDISEECDGNDLGSSSCSDYDFYAGELSCKDNCTIDTTDCTDYCGDGILQSQFESCDGNDFPQGLDCTYFLYTSGEITCTNYCQIDISGCYGLQDPNMEVIACNTIHNMGSNYYTKYIGAYFPNVYWIAYNLTDLHNPYSTIYAFNVLTKTRTTIDVLPFAAPLRGRNLVINPESNGIFFTLIDRVIPSGCSDTSCYIHTAHLFRLDMISHSVEEITTTPLESPDCSANHGQVILTDISPDTGDALIFCDTYLDLENSCYQETQYVYKTNIYEGGYTLFLDRASKFTVQEFQNFTDLNPEYITFPYYQDFYYCGVSLDNSYAVYQLMDNFDIQFTWIHSSQYNESSVAKQVGPEGWLYYSVMNASNRLVLKGDNVETLEEIWAPSFPLHTGQAAPASREYPHLVFFTAGSYLYGGVTIDPTFDIIGAWDKNSGVMRTIVEPSPFQFFGAHLMPGAPDARHLLLLSAEPGSDSYACIFYKDMINAALLTTDGTLIP